MDGARRLPGVAWSYPQPLAGAEALADCVASYPGELECTVDGAIVTPQPGGFYGGWITPGLVGPIKGEPGSEGWQLKRPKVVAPESAAQRRDGRTALLISEGCELDPPTYGGQGVSHLVSRLGVPVVPQPFRSRHDCSLFF